MSITNLATYSRSGPISRIVMDDGKAIRAAIVAESTLEDAEKRVASRNARA